MTIIGEGNVESRANVYNFLHDMKLHATVASYLAYNSGCKIIIPPSELHIIISYGEKLENLFKYQGIFYPSVGDLSPYSRDLSVGTSTDKRMLVTQLLNCWGIKGSCLEPQSPRHD